MTRTSLTLSGTFLLSVVVACSGNASDDDGSGGAGAGGGTGGSGNLPERCSQVLGAELPPGTAPQERGDMVTAYDAECQRVYMLFGDGALPENCGPAASQFLSDAYVYDVINGIWSSIDGVGAGPLPRARARAAWDDARKQVIVFGGRHRDGTVGPYTFLNDVWAFDPATKAWTELSPMGATTGPSGRMNHTMHADPARDRVLVHAGGTTDFDTFPCDNETWAFNLADNTWTQIGMTNPPPQRIFHAAAVDETNGFLVRFGGGDENAFLGPFFSGTWALDLNTDTWTQLSSTNVPPARIKGEMVWDGERNRMVLFAGHDDTDLGNTNDLWTLDLGTGQWTQHTAGDTINQPANGFCDFPADFTFLDETSPERRESHLFVNGGNKALMYGGRTDCGLAKDTWELDYATLTWTMKNDSPVGITCLRTGSPTCVQNDNMCL